MDSQSAVDALLRSPRKAAAPASRALQRYDVASSPPPSSSPPSSSPRSSPFRSSIRASSPPSSLAPTSSPAKHSPLKPTRPAAVAQPTPAAAGQDPFAGLRASPVPTLYGSYTHALLIGRAHSNVAASEVPSASGLGAKPLQRVPLPASARHVSRVHAVVEYLPFPPAFSASQGGDSQSQQQRGCFVVRIQGQNGLIVAGTRRRQGQVLRLRPGITTLDFFGFEVAFAVDARAAGAPQPKAAPAAPLRLAQKQNSPIKLQPHAAPRKPAGLKQSATLPTQAARPRPRPRPTAATAATRPRARSPPPAALRSSSPLAAPEVAAPASARAAAEEAEVDTDLPVSPSLSRKRARPAALAPSSGSELSDVEMLVPQKPVVKRRVGGKVARFEGTPTPVATKEPEAEQDDSDLSDDPNASPSPAIARVRPAPAVAASMPPPAVPVAVSAAAALAARARACVSRLASSYDVEALLAGAIVFHRTATISSSEAIRSVLTSTPGLLTGLVGSHAAIAGAKAGEKLEGWAEGEAWERCVRKAWREELEATLFDKECFGCITRAGKDAGGMPLEPWFYYEQSKDTDRERAANLGAFVKPMRAALKTHKPIFWKKSAYGHAASETAMPYHGTESQLGSAAPLSAVAPSALSSISANTPATQKRAGGGRKSLPSHWEETQMEEREKTWDRRGDEDWKGE